MIPLPPEGPMRPKYGPYLRNPARIAPNLFLCEVQRGTSGRGKSWLPTIIAPKGNEWQQVTFIEPTRGRYALPGYHTVTFCGWHRDGINRPGRLTLPSLTEAIHFACLVTKELFK